MFTGISKKIGFTKTEIKVILFIIVVFCAGLIYKYLINPDKISEYKTYDYSKQDSLFLVADSSSIISDEKAEITDNNIDYKQEVLDFNKDNFSKKAEDEKPLEQKSIDLNTAGVNQLEKLPGIGSVIAQRIIDFRKVNKFNTLKDLQKVKGIGKTKFNNIKKYLYIGK